MLLGLLKPEVRLAYQKANQEFPIPRKNRQFISAGINLRTSGVIDFGALVHEDREAEFDQKLALLFGDFINYWIADDLLQSIQTFYSANDSKILGEVGINNHALAMDAFAKRIAIPEKCYACMGILRALILSKA